MGHKRRCPLAIARLLTLLQCGECWRQTPVEPDRPFLDGHWAPFRDTSQCRVRGCHRVQPHPPIRAELDNWAVHPSRDVSMNPVKRWTPPLLAPSSLCVVGASHTEAADEPAIAPRGGEERRLSNSRYGTRRVRDPPYARGAEYGRLPSTSTGWTLARYSSVSPNPGQPQGGRDGRRSASSWSRCPRRRTREASPSSCVFAMVTQSQLAQRLGVQAVGRNLGHSAGCHRTEGSCPLAPLEGGALTYDRSRPDVSDHAVID
jgi:hypothetical protein